MAGEFGVCKPDIACLIITEHLDQKKEVTADSNHASLCIVWLGNTLERTRDVICLTAIAVA